MKHFLRYDLIPLLSMAAVCAFPCVFMYARNAEEAPVSAMIPFLIVFSVTALGIFGLLSVFLRNVSRAAFLTDLAMLVVINFCLLAIYLKKAMPFFRDRYLLLILGLALLAVFLLLIKKKPDLRTGCLLVLIAFGSMTAINFGLAAPAILGAHQVRRMEQPGPDAPEEDPFDLSGVAFENPDRPNVYYFIFDEYGGYDNLLHYYDYDNSPFLEALADRGFSVSLHSRNTEAIHSDTLVTNLINLNYVTTPADSGHKKAALRTNCQMFRMFAANGYRIDLINHVDYIGTPGTLVLTDRQTRRSISEYLLRNSIFYKSKKARQLLDDFFVLDYGANYRASLDNALEAGMNCWEPAAGAPTLTLGYIQCPHSPTMVGPNGEALPYETGWNWRDHSLFLGQSEFISRYILRLTEELQRRDPEAVIILQSDHGNRYPLHMVDLEELESYDPVAENPYMQNILNCVYVPGREMPIEGESGINTLRLVFREVFGADLPPVEPVVDFTDMTGDEKQ